VQYYKKQEKYKRNIDKTEQIRYIEVT